ncbi:MAG TPA: DUF1801 domain-containing protein [Candidatus Paceibacterota bacterium]|nr:DUF1801 domain-containing protein [Candidatus Paceibacterota bacterium]
MAELKTKPTKESALAFLKTIEPADKRADGLVLLKMFEKATGQKAVMWGTSIVGFGMYHYESERSSQKGDWPLVGFSPRKQNLTLYCMMGNEDSSKLFAKLGKHKTSKGCLYINKLADVDLKTLEALVKKSYVFAKKKLT